MAVIGPNGAGKSTLLAALAGLVAAEGEVAVDGKSWTDPPLSVQDRRVGLVFQAGLLFPHLSALDNVAFGPRSRGVDRAAADALARSWLERFGIADLAATSSAASSPAVRRSASRSPGPWPVEPVLLLLDEPFSGLDTGVATSLRLELARHLAAYDGVCLLVTHDAIDALTLADRVLVLDDGLDRPEREPARRGGQTSYRARGPTRRPQRAARRRRLPGVRTGSRHRLPRRAGGVAAPSLARRRSRRWPSTAPRCGCSSPGERDVLADVTPEAVRELDLEPGREVWVSVKESAISRYSGHE